MTESSKYNINADVNQIIEQNDGNVIGKQNNYATDPNVSAALKNISQLLENLRQK